MKDKSIKANKPEATVTVTVQLPAGVACALKRFAEKVTHSDALTVLYPHLPLELRNDQAHEILTGLHELERALGDAGAATWPWVETGRPVFPPTKKDDK